MGKVGWGTRRGFHSASRPMTDERVSARVKWANSGESREETE